MIQWIFSCSVNRHHSWIHHFFDHRFSRMSSLQSWSKSLYCPWVRTQGQGQYWLLSLHYRKLHDPVDEESINLQGISDGVSFTIQQRSSSLILMCHSLRGRKNSFKNRLMISSFGRNICNISISGTQIMPNQDVSWAVSSIVASNWIVELSGWHPLSLSKCHQIGQELANSGRCPYLRSNEHLSLPSSSQSWANLSHVIHILQTL